jgi:nitric oxide reductase NorE protein
MEKNSIDRYLYYPPGGILIWIIVFIEIITFGMAIVAFLISSRDELNIFHESRLLLNIHLGSLNTLVLIISGYCMAKTLNYYKESNLCKFSLSIKLTMFFGSLFVILKCIEYYHKINSSLFIDTNTFFTFYWLLTVFHLMHVIVGLVILVTVSYKSKSQPLSISLEDIEASAAFWHMCDLIWLLIFPLLYLYN